jgi:branched-chain amino acid transport system substrate-binding protein
MAAIPIVATVSRTGPFAAQRGRDYDQAYALWASDANARGGLLGDPVALHIADDGSSPEAAASLYASLVCGHGAPAMLGPCHTRLADAVIDAAEAIGRPLLQATHGAGEVFDTPRRWHFLCWPGCDRDYPLPWLRHCAAQGMRSAAILTTGGRIGAAVARGIHKWAPSLGLRIASEAVIAEGADYDALAAEARGADTLLVGIDHGRADAPLRSVLEAAARAGIDPARIWVSENPSAADAKLGAAIDGVAMRVTWVPESAEPRSRAFVRRYETQFGTRPGFHAAGAYACGEVLEQAAARAGSLDAGALRDALVSATFDTVVGPLRFDANGRPDCALGLARWQRGQLHLLGETP